MKKTPNKSKSKVSSIKSKKKVLTKMSQEIASLKVKCKELDSEKGCTSGADNDNVQDNTGNQRGGRKDKKRAKTD
jgi:hypothetical protein